MNKKLVIGIDIGGSKIRAVFPTSEIRTPKNLFGFKKALRSLAAKATKIGIAVPGRVRGTIFVSATNLSYIRNFDFVRFFPNAKVRVDHDARCFSRAEYRSKQTTLFLTLGTGVGRAVAKNGKVLKIKKFEYPERWEKEYKKLRDKQDNAALAKFLAKKLNNLLMAYSAKLIVVGGGVSTRKGFVKKLQKALNLPVKKSYFGKNSVAIGAAMLFKQE